MTTTTRPNPATPGRKVGARACVDDFFSDLSAAANGGMKVRERYAVLGACCAWLWTRGLRA